MKRLLFAITLATFCVRLSAQENDTPMGMPFGRIGDADVDRLQQFAKASRFDLKGEVDKVYRSGKRIDEDALGRVFKFSLAFNALDGNARAYGQIIYSSLLNIGEVIGVPAYTKIIDRQPPVVQQRIRDFLYYPVWKTHRNEARKLYERVYPGLYPKEYEFGRNDPIFAKET